MIASKASILSILNEHREAVHQFKNAEERDKRLQAQIIIAEKQKWESETRNREQKAWEGGRAAAQMDMLGLVRFLKYVSLSRSNPTGTIQENAQEALLNAIYEGTAASVQSIVKYLECAQDPVDGCPEVSCMSLQICL